MFRQFTRCTHPDEYQTSAKHTLMSKGGLGSGQSIVGVGLRGLHPQTLVDGNQEAAH